eukprot:comp23180_c1_seq1/m.37562 comp23180_c1_seq1/g.37562  ORF comp23180_c1_seq1/g.37562 comp23180_c1_seq1/m.37562 type:complete len:611 (-) comp23180_c1_seq1:1191-3023(-)
MAEQHVKELDVIPAEAEVPEAPAQPGGTETLEARPSTQQTIQVIEVPETTEVTEIESSEIVAVEVDNVVAEGNEKDEEGQGKEQTEKLEKKEALVEEEKKAPDSPKPQKESEAEKAAARERKRKRVIAELLATEETYMTGVDILLKKFKEPLEEAIKANKPILPKAVVDKVFMSLPEIAGVSNVLKESLKTKPVGQAFLDIWPFFKLYSTYAMFCDGARTQIGQHMVQNPDFAKWKLEQEKHFPSPMLKMEGYLITPVQRPPRYALILKELLKCTEDDDPDRPALESALSKVEDICSHINEYVRNAERMQALVEIQSTMWGLKDPLVKPGRQFILKDVCMRVRDQTNKARYMFLFSDMLLCARPDIKGKYVYGDSLQWTGTTFIYRDQIPLDSITARALPDTGLWYQLQKPGLHWFEIMGSKRKKINVILGVETAAKQQQWVEALNNASSELASQRNSFVQGANSTNDTLSRSGSIVSGITGSNQSLDAENSSDEEGAENIIGADVASTVRVVADDGNPTIYTFEFEWEGMQYKLAKRFSEILPFYESIADVAKFMRNDWRPFPAKHFFDRYQKWIIEQRRYKFERMFSDLILTKENMALPQVRAFMNLP